MPAARAAATAEGGRQMIARQNEHRQIQGRLKPCTMSAKHGKRQRRISIGRIDELHEERYKKQDRLRVQQADQ